MSRTPIKVDVDLNGVPEKIEKQIKKGIQNSRKEVPDQGIPVAKDKILEEGAVWKGELFTSFQWGSKKVGDKYVITIENVADHAAPMEEGADYDGTAPPIENLMPWVKTELADWNVSQKWIALAALHLDVPPGKFKHNKELYGKAYWLQQHIKREGLEPRRFMEAMERYLREHADEIVGGEITEALKQL